MKRIVVVLFFLVFSQLFADESVFFSWQLCYNLKTNQEINFLNVNPLFFDVGAVFPQEMLYLSNINNIPQARQKGSSNYEENDVLGFISSLFAWASHYYVYSSMNRQDREIYSSAWEQQKNAEQLRRRFFEYSYGN